MQIDEKYRYGWQSEKNPYGNLNNATSAFR
jgi:hypothetical protein